MAQIITTTAAPIWVVSHWPTTFYSTAGGDDPVGQQYHVVGELGPSALRMEDAFDSNASGSTTE